MVSLGVVRVIDGYSARGNDSTFNILVPVSFCTCSVSNTVSQQENIKKMSSTDKTQDLPPWLGNVLRKCLQSVMFHNQYRCDWI